MKWLRRDVRRAKLYYIRGRSGKKARITEKRMDNKADIKSPKVVKEDKLVTDTAKDTVSKDATEKNKILGRGNLS